MMTVKELKEKLANANDNDVVFFMSAREDRDGYWTTIKTRGIFDITTESISDERKKELEYYGY